MIGRLSNSQKKKIIMLTLIFTAGLAVEYFYFAFLSDFIDSEKEQDNKINDEYHKVDGKIPTEKLIKEEIKEPVFYDYVEIIEGCHISIDETCTKGYKTPSFAGIKSKDLRIGTVLKVEETIKNTEGVWHKITFEDDWIRYPERISGDFYVNASSTIIFQSNGVEELDYLKEKEDRESEENKERKKIIVDRSDQTIYAYNSDGSLFLEQIVSTGLEITPTPRGEFEVFKKMPSRYMQGPLPGINDKYYDLPGVPWNLYFTHQGGALHGTYWHDNWGKKWSSGCVNINPEIAKKLYDWADVGTKVFVRD